MVICTGPRDDSGLVVLCRFGLGATIFQMIDMMSSLIKAEDSAGEGHKRRSWWVQPGQIEPGVAELSNASWRRRLARPARMSHL